MPILSTVGAASAQGFGFSKGSSDLAIRMGVVLMAGGGAGGGGTYHSGGGGAGQIKVYAHNANFGLIGTSYVVTIGAGGVCNTASSDGSFGHETSIAGILSLTSTGTLSQRTVTTIGGGGGKNYSTGGGGASAGGACGGGGSGYNSAGVSSAGGSASGGSWTDLYNFTHQHQAGGAGSPNQLNHYGSGGGGGIIAAGGNGTGTVSGSGGSGQNFYDLVSSTPIGGGGGGAGWQGGDGQGGYGGGGAAGTGSGRFGAANRGAGGGAPTSHNSIVGGSGGSGFLKIIFAYGGEPASATGSYVRTTNVSGTVVYTFNGSGGFTL